MAAAAVSAGDSARGVGGSTACCDCGCCGGGCGGGGTMGPPPPWGALAPFAGCGCGAATGKTGVANCEVHSSGLALVPRNDMRSAGLVPRCGGLLVLDIADGLGELELGSRLMRRGGGCTTCCVATGGWIATGGGAGGWKATGGAAAGWIATGGGAKGTAGARADGSGAAKGACPSRGAATGGGPGRRVGFWYGGG